MLGYVLTGILSGAVGGVSGFHFAVSFIKNHYNVTPKE